MKGFNFEKNLKHQSQAVKSTVTVFDNLEVDKTKGDDKQFLNPVINIYSGVSTSYAENIYALKKAQWH